MKTYFIRHTNSLRIDDATREKLWADRRIAIHFPDNSNGRMGPRDNSSLDPNDYPKKGRKQMRTLCELAKTGGYVCAEHYGKSDCLLGYVKPGSKIDLVRGHWDGESGYGSRKAILKSLRLGRVRLLAPCDSAVILVGRPRQGTIAHWRRGEEEGFVRNIVDGRHVRPSLGTLHPYQQEIMCGEFLRSREVKAYGLPRLAHLLLPIGRNLRGIDICGITESGRTIFAQVTYHRLEHCDKKMKSLLAFRDGRRNDLILFCKASKPTTSKGVKIVPLQAVYEKFAATATGKRWVERVANPIR